VHEKKHYGYIRVSTKQQNIDRQLFAMEKVEIPKGNLFIDKISGENFKRPGYKRMVRRLKPKDVLFIKSIDRLGRNYDDIIQQWKFLTRDKDIDIVVIDFPLLDTRNQVNGITGKFIADLVLQILSYIAQVERENIKQRQAEGIVEAKKRGVKFGRPKREVPENFEEIYSLWMQGEISQKEAGRRLFANNHTFMAWVKRNDSLPANQE
jgi:Site-specific recombinases, DNA invertase Pin homologs